MPLPHKGPVRWTHSQQALLKAGEAEIEGNFELQIIRLIHEGCGVTKALRHLQAKSIADAALPRNVLLFGSSQWNAVSNLAIVCGLKTGTGYLDCMFRCLKHLSGAEKRPLVLWIDECRSMKPVHQETLVALLEHVARDEKIPLRVALIIGRVRVWINRDEDPASKTFKQFIGARKNRFLMSERLCKKGQVWDMTSDGMAQIDQLDFSEPINAHAALA